MKFSFFKAKLIEIIFPPILEGYEKYLIPKFKEISKPALESKLQQDADNPMGYRNWAYLYLDEDRLYKELRSEMLTQNLPEYDPENPESEIDDFFANLYLEQVKLIMEDFSFENEESLINQFFDDNLSDQEFFIQTSIAQFYNSLSVIQSGKRINDLLREFIEKGNQLSLVKAIKVDPSVLSLDNIQQSISLFDPIKRNKLEHKIQDAKSIPHLTPDDRKKHLLLVVFLNFVSSLGFLSDPDPIPNKELLKLADGFNLIPVDFDPDEFRKIASYYRSR